MNELVNLPSMPGLADSEQDTLRRLVNQLAAVRSKNLLLSAYYDGKRALKSLGIAIPPNMRIDTALQWPERAVKALASKHVFEGFTLDGSSDPFEAGELLEQNQFGLDLMQGINSAYKHACSFLTVSHGDTDAGEPEVVVQARSAESTTALWDKRTRSISAALAVIDIDNFGKATDFQLMFRGYQWRFRRNELGRWEGRRTEGVPGRVLVEMLRHDPQLNRPFGASRINREVRYLTDAAIRTLARAELSGEFFSAPQRYALGVDRKAFDGDDSKWTATMGRIWALQSNEDGEVPTVGQFPQVSMEPHLAHYRQLAQNFAAATSLPMSMVGQFGDNPASAEAMQSADAERAELADLQWRVFTPALVRTLQSMVMLRDGSSEVPAGSWKTRIAFKPTRYVSPQSSGDFISKAVAAVPKIGETTEALRGLGFNEAQIEGMQSEWRRAGQGSVLEQLLAGRAPAAATVTPAGE